MKKGLFIFLFWLNFSGFFAQADTLRLMFTGDIMAHGPQLRAAYNPQTGAYDFSDSFMYLKKIFRDADFVIGNLETTLGTRPYSGYPRFSAPPSLASALKEAGFTHVVTANNHACDKGKSGIVRTLQILDSLHLGHTGTFASLEEKERHPFIRLKKNGFDIILLNYTYGTNGLPIPQGTVVNLMDKEQMRRDIARAKKEHPGQIIVFLHWGLQYKAMPSAKQKEVENFLRKQGVDIIIGSHPHVIQPVAFNGQQLTVYSLGNFISNQRTFPRDGAFIFRLDLVKKDGKTTVAQAGYIPFWVYKYSENGQTFFEILPTDEFLAERGYFTLEKDYRKFLTFHRYVTDFMKKNAPGIRHVTGYAPLGQIKTLAPVLPPVPTPPLLRIYRLKTR